MTNKKIEDVIITELIYNQDFAKSVIYNLKPEFFETYNKQIVFDYILKYYDNYLEVPASKDVILVEIQESDLENKIEVISYLNSLKKDREYILPWLISKTEEWAKNRVLYLALSKSVDIADGKNTEVTKESIPDILKDALAFGFLVKLGHDYQSDLEDRYNSYVSEEIKIPFDLEVLNQITNGGVERKTLNLIMGATGGFKSLFLCHLAARYYLSGMNVFYFTLELSEKKVAQRIDANIMNIPLQELTKLSFSEYSEKFSKSIAPYSTGNLIIKEYPTVGASALDFKTFIHETALRRGIVPDVIIVDYLNICSSYRIKGSASSTYHVAKSIAEELRGMAVENDVPVWTATQLTRSAQKSEDPDLSDISESFGVAATCDFVASIITNDELMARDTVVIKQLKNRYGDLYRNNRVELGIDRSKMLLYNMISEEFSRGEVTTFEDLLND